MGIPYGEEIMIVSRTVWTQCSARVWQTDGRTDGQTDRRTDRITITKTVQRRASHGKNRLIYSNMCYFGTTKVEMIKFATVMANSVQNNLWKFRKRILKYTANNNICSMGAFYCRTLYGSPIILVSGDIKFIPKFEGDHPERGRRMRVGCMGTNRRFSTNKPMPPGIPVLKVKNSSPA